jgi:hypothetical protein
MHFSVHTYIHTYVRTYLHSSMSRWACNTSCLFHIWGNITMQVCKPPLLSLYFPAQVNWIDLTRHKTNKHRLPAIFHLETKSLYRHCYGLHTVYSRGNDFKSAPLGCKISKYALKQEMMNTNKLLFLIILSSQEKKKTNHGKLKNYLFNITEHFLQIIFSLFFLNPTLPVYTIKAYCEKNAYCL